MNPTRPGMASPFRSAAHRGLDAAEVSGDVVDQDALDGLLARGLEGRIDMAFIDANKNDYDAYYERCLSLLRPGGLILIDNVLWGGSVVDRDDKTADTRASRALNAKLAKQYGEAEGKRAHVSRLLSDVWARRVRTRLCPPYGARTVRSPPIRAGRRRRRGRSSH